MHSEWNPHEYGVPLTNDDEIWLSKANAVVSASSDLSFGVNFRIERAKIGAPWFDRSLLMRPLRDLYAHLELSAPVASQGAFIPPGETFNGFAALVRVIQLAKRELYFVDPYADASLFLDLAPMVPETVRARCLTSKQNAAALGAVFRKWVDSGEQNLRPFELRVAKPKALHDRCIIVDDQAVWSVSQSFKDIAARSAASVTEDRTDLASLKVQHLNELWEQAELIQIDG